jgi:pimeloyl-ACP methyl ester carboxylesterase/DNA-binding CsgD family transcriptional regulator
MDMPSLSVRNFASQHDRLLDTLAERIDTSGSDRIAPDDWQNTADLLLQTGRRSESLHFWLLVHPDGRIVDCSASAAARFGLQGPGDRLYGVAGRLSGSQDPAEVVAVTDLAGETLILQATPTSDRTTWQLYPVSSPVTPAFRSAIVAFWSLTPVEADIALALFEGQNADQIAAESGRTKGTVRQVIKAILAKMQVGSQAQAVSRLSQVALAGAANRISPQEMAQRRRAALWGSGNGGVAFWRYGDPAGRPVLFFHGALFGIAGHTDAIHAARLFGFDVIAPERPGYGSTPLPESADPVALSVAHAKAILDSERVERVLLMAHDVGSVYAFAFARSHPDRVSSILCAPATPPMMGWAQTSDMPPLHRVSAFAAQKAPALMEMLVKIGLQRIAREGLSVIPRLVFADSEHDREVLLRAQSYGVLEQLYQMAIERNAEGFVQDMFVTNRNWSDWLPGIAHPVRLLHGQRSRTVSEKALRRMCAILPDAALTVIPDAGHTVPITHNEQIFRQAFQLD